MKKTNYGALKFLSFLFPIVAVIFYFIEVDKNGEKADACFTGIIISIIASLFIGLLSIAIFFSVKENIPDIANGFDEQYTEEIIE